MRARCVVEAWNPSVHTYSSSNQRSRSASVRVGHIVAHTLPSTAWLRSRQSGLADQRLTAAVIGRDGCCERRTVNTPSMALWGLDGSIGFLRILRQPGAPDNGQLAYR